METTHWLESMPLHKNLHLPSVVILPRIICMDAIQRPGSFLKSLKPFMAD